MWKYKIGTVVKHDPIRDMTDKTYGWGHVTGFCINAFGETVIIVKWSDGKEFPVHTANVITEEDDVNINRTDDRT